MITINAVLGIILLFSRSTESTTIHVHCILTPTLPQRFSGPAERGDFALTVGSLLKKF